MAKKKDDGQLPPPVVRVAPLGELKAYTLSEHELDRLAKGAAVSDLLTIAYVLVSVAFTILATLLSTTLPQLNFIIFVCAFLIFLLGGVICGIVGWRMRESVHTLVADIKNRMPPPPGIREVLAEKLEIAQMVVAEKVASGEKAAPQSPQSKTQDEDRPAAS